MKDGRIMSFRVSNAQCKCNQPVLKTIGGSRRNRGGTIWKSIHGINGTEWICGPWAVGPGFWDSSKR